MYLKYYKNIILFIYFFLIYCRHLYFCNFIKTIFITDINIFYCHISFYINFYKLIYLFVCIKLFLINKDISK